MMDPNVIVWGLEFNRRALSRNLEGLTHEECLVQPPQGNCINWLMGHILVYRNMMLELLDAAPVWRPEAAERYGRGSAPIRSEEDRPERLEVLREEIERADQRLVETLESTERQKLEKAAGTTTLGRRLNFLVQHEAYHIGQVALLRRIAGREGAIT